MQPFYRLADISYRLIEGDTLADGKSQASIAGLIIGAGQNQISDPRQAHKGLLPATQFQAEAHDFGQPPCNQRCTSIGAVTQSIRYACGNGKHVLDRATKLDTDHVVAGISPEAGTVEQLDHSAGIFDIFRSDSYSGRQPPGDFICETGA